MADGDRTRDNRNHNSGPDVVGKRAGGPFSYYDFAGFGTQKPLYIMKERTRMDIEQVRAARREMEFAILTATTTAMADFRAKTGLSPASIDVRLGTISSMGEQEPIRVAMSVHADVPL